MEETYLQVMVRDSQEYITVMIRHTRHSSEEIDKIVQNYEKLYICPCVYVLPNRDVGIFWCMQFAVDPILLNLLLIIYLEAMYLAARTGNVATSVLGLEMEYLQVWRSSMSYSIDLQGYAYDELEELANDIKNRLEKNRRVREVISMRLLIFQGMIFSNINWYLIKN